MESENINPKEKSLTQRFWRSGVYQWKKFLRMRDSLHALALGFSIGAFVSFTPFIFFHLIIAALVSWFLRANIIASAFGTVVGNPFTFPFIWIASYQIGISVIGGDAFSDLPPEITGATLITYAQSHIWDVFLPMLIGGASMGIIAGILFYPLTYYAIGSYRRRKSMRKSRNG